VKWKDMIKIVMSFFFLVKNIYNSCITKITMIK
jgi:hypothetical protein